MLVYIWRRLLARHAKAAGRKTAVGRRYRPLLDVLEDRCMPSLVTVTSASDDPNDTGSLRYALDNVTPGGTIDFAPGVRTIDLSRTVNIGMNLNIINDQGAGPVTIQAAEPFPVFTVSTPLVVASLSGLTVYANSGGGILNYGTLNVSNCTFFPSGGNVSEDGGAIYNDGNLTVSNCTLSGITADGVGGGIYNSGSLTVVDSTFSNNSCARRRRHLQRGLVDGQR